jgi:ABC-type transporter Mla subunit MlaD
MSTRRLYTVTAAFDNVGGLKVYAPVAAIQTTGLLGGNFIAINPGAAVTSLRDGSEILATNSAFSIERLIGSVECVQRSAHCAALPRH